MKKLLPVLVAAALVGGSVNSYAASEDYVAGFVGDATILCKNETPAGVNVGGACFQTGGSKSSVRVTVNDLLVGTVGFWYAEYNSAGDCQTPDPDVEGLCNLQGGFCDTQLLSLAPSTRSIVVVLDGPAFGPLDCPDPPGMATAGTIVATFS